MEIPWNEVLHLVRNILFWVIGLAIPLAIATYGWFSRDMLTWVHSAFYFKEEKAGKKSILIRTIDIQSVRHLMMNNIFATLLIYMAARKATTDSPVLQFSEKHSWRIRNLCRGYLSNLFREGILAKVMQIPVKQDWFVVTLIRDETQRGDNRVGMAVIRRSDISDPNFLSGDPDTWALEAGHHENKLRLLRQLQDAYRSDPNHSQFLECELYTAL